MKFSKMLAAITQVLNQDLDTQVDVCMTSEMARRIELCMKIMPHGWTGKK